MTAALHLLQNVKYAHAHLKINLPNGDTTCITHVGNIQLSCGLKLLNVLYVPNFHHNLLSIHKLAKDNHCEVTFSPTSCVLFDSDTHEIKGIGFIKDGLYYLTE